MWENLENPDHFIVEKFEMLDSEELSLKIVLMTIQFLGHFMFNYRDILH